MANRKADLKATVAQAPDVGGAPAAADSVDEEVSKRQVAKHSLLNATGEVVEDIKDATGIRYQDIQSGKTFDYQMKPNSAGLLMFALFGARTLATNEASAVRQVAKKAGEADNGGDQVEAIRERFEMIDSGEWVDRTREGGVRIDRDTLAKAAVNVLVRLGKIPADQADTYNAKLLEGFEKGNPAKKLTGVQMVAQIRQVDGVEAEYKKLAGKVTRTADDLLAALG